MYGKEEFIKCMNNARFIHALSFWINQCANPSELDTIKQKHPEMPDDLVDCYIWEVAKWYKELKCTEPEDFKFRKNGMKLEEEVYYYPPYTPGVFLGVLYAMFVCDAYPWEKDIKLHAMLRVKMEAEYKDHLDDVLTILSECWIPMDKIKARRTRSISRIADKTQALPKQSLMNREDGNASMQTDVELSFIFSDELRTDGSKREAFVKVIRDGILPEIKKTKGFTRDNKWKWGHLKQALIDAKYITECNDTSFGEGMAPVALDIAHNIQQRCKTHEARPTDGNIIKTMQKRIEDAIKNADKPEEVVRAVAKPRVIHRYGEGLDELFAIHEGMGLAAYYLLSLEPFFVKGITREMMIACFYHFGTTYSMMLDKFDRKRGVKILCQLINRLWNVRILNPGIPVVEYAKALKSVMPTINSDRLRKQLMSADMETYSKAYEIFFDLFEQEFGRFVNHERLP